ncbi:sulfate transporter [Kordiimonas sediminis]|uniref:Sulfate transporter n=1 Tax=Kordiimonas sediminis TaxID=1735581 RepID=A0A919E454_9PROT|nr:ABC transporter permease [Kordiimonas sediminis]GHF11844.1 sulfate transporter [Kordiimonas sediminis]
MSVTTDFFEIEDLGATKIVALSGDWTIDTAEAIDRLMGVCVKSSRGATVLDCSHIGKMDTTGAVLIRRYADALDSHTGAVLTGVTAQHKGLMAVVSCKPPPAQTCPDEMPWYFQFLEDVGLATRKLTRITGAQLNFIGLVFVRLFGSLTDPRRIRWTALIHQIEAVGLKSMGIVGLIAFLIGAVMVNQGAIQLARFGADIFVVDMLGIAHLRELGILLTAIIIAGRSGSAFTAAIGSMKLHEEVDAMKTIGLNPIDVLVLPRLVALVIALPLLTFYADIMGVLGGALMAWVQLNITPANFFVYFQEVISADHFFVGLIKAPFFAVVIAITGCFNGLNVRGSAESLGVNTTQAVVQAIFLVIVLDALFAIFFTAIDL